MGFLPRFRRACRVGPRRIRTRYRARPSQGRRTGDHRANDQKTLKKIYIYTYIFPFPRIKIFPFAENAATRHKRIRNNSVTFIFGSVYTVFSSPLSVRSFCTAENTGDDRQELRARMERKMRFTLILSYSTTRVEIRLLGLKADRGL